MVSYFCAYFTHFCSILLNLPDRRRGSPGRRGVYNGTSCDRYQKQEFDFFVRQKEDVRKNASKTKSCNSSRCLARYLFTSMDFSASNRTTRDPTASANPFTNTFTHKKARFFFFLIHRKYMIEHVSAVRCFHDARLFLLRRISTYITSIYHKKIYFTHVRLDKRNQQKSQAIHRTTFNVSHVFFLYFHILTSNKRYKNKRKTPFRVF